MILQFTTLKGVQINKQTINITWIWQRKRRSCLLFVEIIIINLQPTTRTQNYPSNLCSTTLRNSIQHSFQTLSAAILTKISITLNQAILLSVSLQLNLLWIRTKNHTNEKYKDVWSKGSDNQWIKSFKQQQQSTALKPSVEQHHKNNKAIRISNERE